MPLPAARGFRSPTVIVSSLANERICSSVHTMQFRDQLAAAQF
jgi:hypothetical protein